MAVASLQAGRGHIPCCPGTSPPCPRCQRVCCLRSGPRSSERGGSWRNFVTPSSISCHDCQTACPSRSVDEHPPADSLHCPGGTGVLNPNRRGEPRAGRADPLLAGEHADLHPRRSRRRQDQRRSTNGHRSRASRPAPPHPVAGSPGRTRSGHPTPKPVPSSIGHRQEAPARQTHPPPSKPARTARTYLGNCVNTTLGNYVDSDTSS